MKNIYLKIVLAFAVILFTGCESYTEDMNVDPNQFTDAAPELIIGQAQLGWAVVASGNTARYAGIFSNQLTGADRQFVSANSYSITANSFDDEWYQAYVTGLSQAKVVYNKAMENQNNTLAAVALITEAAIIGQITSLWGDVPYEEASIDGILNPAYDSQEMVYNRLQQRLSEAIDLLGDDSTQSLVYAGEGRLSSSASWSTIAHSLKARYYLHMKNYQSALEEAKLGINTPSGTLHILHGTSNGNSNLYYQFVEIYRYGYLDASDAYLRDLLIPENGIDRSLNTPGDLERLNFYYIDTQLNTSSEGIFAQDASFPLISYEEVQLIEAESAYRMQDEDTAREALNEVRDYLGNFYNADFPETTDAGEILLKQILEEKYISLFGQLEPFNDLRRTGNLIGVRSKVDGNQLPQRFLYPQNEIDTNPNAPSPIPGLFEATPVNN
ncbi:SusD/RagB family nutrient-binding outer membrane lipoprotein [Flavobacteriaceae bacterium Ap0902]|nr:SusD/RagB family nutrient-binding outer membrane lipoprotein [Flavobacteriaceae bacterium Ap0902]